MPQLRLRSCQQRLDTPPIARTSSHSPSPPSRRIAMASSFDRGEPTITPDKKRRANSLSSTKTILTTMFFLSTLMLLSSGRIHARLSNGMYNRDYNDGWELLRKRRPLQRHKTGFRPRVINLAESIPTDTQNRVSVFTRIYKLLFRRRRVMDPMLHHDGWKESELDEISSGWLDANIWKHEMVDDAQQQEEDAQCVPMAEWQTTSYPNCNLVHEIDLVLSSSQGTQTFPSHDTPTHNSPRRRISHFPSLLSKRLKRYTEKDYTNHKNLHLNANGVMKEEDLTFLGQGWFRSAWKMDVEGMPGYWDEEEEEVVFGESVVLKTLRIEREFLQEYYELHRRDALAMERLTFSPYVLNIYGYCGQSAINELANFGIEGLASLEKIARQFRGANNVEPVNKIKLQLASMVAAGVSHMHSIDYPDHIPSNGEEKKKKKAEPYKVRSNATLVHYDLNPRNIAIVKRGKPKLNDFNVAEFLTWDTKRNATCGFKGRFREPWWRSPEEMQLHDSAYKDKELEPLTEKVDIYSLGNILLTLLTSHSPWGKMTKELMEEVRPKVARGELPKLPSDFNETEAAADPALSPILKAMYKCLRALPEDRPSAGEIAEELELAVDSLPDGYGDKEKFFASMRRERRLEEPKSSSDV